MKAYCLGAQDLTFPISRNFVKSVSLKHEKRTFEICGIMRSDFSIKFKNEAFNFFFIMYVTSGGQIFTLEFSEQSRSIQSD